jgi:hypothetical protein
MAVFSTINIDKNQLDASGFVPTSFKTIIGNYVQDKDNLPLSIDRVGTGSQVWANGEVTMSVTAGQFAIAQTRVCHPYISAHSSLYDITFAAYGIQANVYKRVGAVRGLTLSPHAIRDGVYFESDGVANTFNLVIIKGGATTTIPRATWNDPLNGSGASGINYDFNNFTVLQIDFLYLGGTAVRFFLNVGGTLVLFHTYKHSGTSATTFVNSPYFHIRWEIRSVGGNGSCKQICGAFSTLGGFESLGKEYSFDVGNVQMDAATAGAEYLLMAIRLKSTALNSYVFPNLISTLSATNDNYLVRVRMNPTIAGAVLVWNGLNNTAVETALGAVAGGNTTSSTNPPLLSYYAAQETEKTIDKALLTALGSTIAGVSDIITISAIPIGAGTPNLDIYSSVGLKEL